MKRPLVTIAAMALIVAVAGVLLGAWWTPFLVGVALGLSLDRARWAVPWAAACGLLAWLLPLLGVQVRYGLAPTAGAFGAILGFDHQGALPVILTLVVGTLLGLCGAWLATAARLLISPRWSLIKH